MKTRMPSSSCLLVLTAVVAALLSSCATTGQTTTVTGIETSFKDSYAYKTYLQNDEITLQTQDGKVSLTGTVPEESHKLLAENTVKGIPGVKSVDNKLQVEGGSPIKGSDAWLGSRVKAKLMSHPDVNVTSTEVYVKDKVVTLKGSAESDAQKSLMSEYAKDVEGVKQVENELTVAAAEPQPPVGQAAVDASITSQAMLKLDANPSTSEVDAVINTSNGSVTVQGRVDNQAQKDLVTELIAGIQGVTSVDNQMIVEEVAAYTE